MKVDKRVFTVSRCISICLALFLLLSTFMTTVVALGLNYQHRSDYLKADNRMYAVYLQKYEKDASGAHTTVPVAGAEFILYRLTGDGNREQIGNAVYYTDADGGIMIEDLAPGEYAFLETNPTYAYLYDWKGGGEVREYRFAVLDDEVQHILVYNRRRTADLRITKTVWNADETELTEQQLDMEFVFTVTVTEIPDGFVDIQINDEQQQLPVVGGQLSFVLKHEGTAVIQNLPVGSLYRVIEAPAEDYVVQSSNHSGTILREGAAADFVNIYKYELTDDEFTDLVISKIVEGELSDPDMDFHFSLIVDGEIFEEFNLKNGENKIVSLPAGAVYEVMEDDYFSNGFVQFIVNGYGIAHGESIEAAQFNIYVEKLKIEIYGEKTWDLSADPEAELPESVTVYLIDGEVRVDTAVVKPDENGRWLYRFTVPKYASDDTEIRYTVQEAPVLGFTSEVDGYNIKNVCVLQPETVTINGTKTWHHGNNSPAKYPQSITVYVKDGETIVEQQIITAADNWEYSFVLPREDADGNTIVYMIDEADIPDYTRQVDGYNLTNIYRPADTGDPGQPADPPVNTNDNNPLDLWILWVIISSMTLFVSILSSRQNRYLRRKKLF